MPRLVIKDAELMRILVKHYGFSIYGRHGSHVKLRDLTVPTTIISIHNEQIRQGTLNAILKQTELKKEDIFKYY